MRLVPVRSARLGEQLMFSRKPNRRIEQAAGKAASWATHLDTFAASSKSLLGDAAGAGGSKGRTAFEQGSGNKSPMEQVRAA